MNTLHTNLILYNGTGISMEKDAGQISAIAVQGEKILATGQDEEILRLRQKNTRVIDLQGQTFLPGFIKTHAHPMIMGQDMMELDCGGDCGSIAEMVERVEQAARELPQGAWIIGKGWDEARLAEKRQPTKADFAQAVPDHPILLYRICRHIGVVNQKALDLYGMDGDLPPAPPGGQIQRDVQTGKPTGILVGPAVEMMPLPARDAHFLRESYQRVEEDLIGKGITTVADMTVFPDSMRLYQQLARSDELRLRLRLWIPGRTAFGYTGRLEDFCQLGVESGVGNHRIGFQGLKFYVDGSLGGRTALMKEGYPDEPERLGEKYCDQETLNAEIRRASVCNLRTAVHAIGDQAIEMVLRAHEDAAASGDFRWLRNRIEHCAVPTPEQIDRIARLGLCVGSSIGFLYSLAVGYRQNLHPQQVDRVFPQNSYTEKGIPHAANSDAPVCDPNPMLGIYSAAFRRGRNGESFGDQERISVLQALRSYTADAAYLHGDETILGTLTPGKLADIAVLDGNPLKAAPEDILNIRTVLTVSNGQVVFQR